MHRPTRDRLLPLLALVAAHCNPPSAPPPTPAEHASAAAPVASASPAASTKTAPPPPPPAKAAAAGDLAPEYRGALGAGLAVVARLTRTGDKVHGVYFYEKAGESLTLEGSMTGSHLLLDELAGKKKTGAIEADVGTDGTLTGTWTDPTKKRTLPLHLASIPVDAAPTTALLFKRAHHEHRPVPGSKTDMCKTDLEYAEVFGLPAAVEAKINQRLAPEADVLTPGPCDHAVESTAGYEIKHNANGILSLEVSGAVSDSQAAHPDSGTSPVTVWLASGVDVKLFGDVVDPKDAPSVRRQLGLVADRLLHAAGEGADMKSLVMDSFGDAPSFVIEKQGVNLCASTPPRRGQPRRLPVSPPGVRASFARPGGRGLGEVTVVLASPIALTPRPTILAVVCLLPAIFTVACGPGTAASAPPAVARTSETPPQEAPTDPKASLEELRRGFAKGCDETVVGAEYCACAWDQMQATFTPEEMKGSALDPAQLETFKGRTKEHCLGKLPEPTVRANFVKACDGGDGGLAPYCECVWSSYRTVASSAELAESKLVQEPRFGEMTKVAVKACGAKALEAPSKGRFMKACAADPALGPFCDCSWKTLRKGHGPAEVMAGTFGLDTIDAVLTKACGTLKPKPPPAQ